MAYNSGFEFQDLLNTSFVYGDSGNFTTLNLSSATAKCPVFADAGKNIITQGPLLDGQLVIGKTGNLPTIGSLTAGLNMSVSQGAGTLAVATIASPTFSNLIDSGLTATTLVGADASKQLQSLSLASTNGVVASVSGSTLTINTPQDLQITASPVFANLTDSGLTASRPVRSNGSKQLVSGTTDLASTNDITGVLAIANGGTNSSSALANTKLMVSSGSKIVEGTSSTDPVFIGTMTAANVIDSGLTATTLVAADSGKQLQSISIANNNGCNISFAGSTLTTTMTQDLRTTGTPSFANITDTGITGMNMVSTNNSNRLVSTSLGSSNGCVLGLSASNFTVDTPQDVRTTAAPTFSGLTDTGLTATTLVAADSGKQLQSISIANTNGCNISFAGSTLTTTMTQDLRTTGSPSFANITDTGITGMNMVSTNNSNRLVSTSLGSANGCVLGLSASNFTVDTPQDVRTTASPTFDLITTTTGVKFPTSGGTATTLNFYEEATHTTSWNGAFGASSVSGNVKFTRIGRIVTATFPAITGTCTATNPLWMMTNAPSRFLPATDNYIVAGIAQTAAGTLNATGIFYVASGGNFQFHNGVGQTFSNAGSPTVGLAQACSVTYSV